MKSCCLLVYDKRDNLVITILRSDRALADFFKRKKQYKGISLDNIGYVFLYGEKYIGLDIASGLRDIKSDDFIIG